MQSTIWRYRDGGGGREEATKDMFVINTIKIKLVLVVNRRSGRKRSKNARINRRFLLYTVFQKKTSTHIIGYKLRNSCPILIIFDTKIPHII